MAKLPRGIFGPFSGKIGPIVGASWNGVAYIRAKPKKKKKKKSKRSAARIANEAKFKFGNLCMIPFHPYIIVGFQNLPANKPPISIAFALNYRQVIIGSYPDFDIDVSKIILSVGELPGLNQPVATIITPDTLELTWQPTSSLKASFDDQIMLVLYNKELQLTDGFIGGIKRTSQKCSYQFDKSLIGKVLDVFISVSSLNRKKMATSVYLGQLRP